MSQDINVLALVKGRERYVFLYNDENRAGTLLVLGRYASNPELSFTWYDAAVLSQKIRQETNKGVGLKEKNPSGLCKRFDLPLPSSGLLKKADLPLSSNSDFFVDGFNIDGL